jgi:hypothetical protein
LIDPALNLLGHFDIALLHKHLEGAPEVSLRPLQGVGLAEAHNALEAVSFDFLCRV